MNRKSKKTSAFFSIAIVVTWIALCLLTVVRPVSANTFTVTTTGDNGGVNPAPGAGTGTLRQAIIDANATAGADTINFAAGVTGTITLANALPQITQDLTINGPGAGVLTVSGNSLFQVFNIAGFLTASISSLTISNGNSVLGGGISNSGMLSITNCTISGNSAGFAGGGIINNPGGTLSVNNSTISGNRAGTFGGGIGNFITELTITNSTFSGNSSDNTGGGIFNNGSLSVTNSTFSGNSAGVASGIFTASPATFKNSITANSISGGNCAGAGSINSVGVNFSTDNTCAGFTQVTPQQLNLSPLQFNGGPTQTHALIAGSVAIDAVTDCTDVVGNQVITDQRGVTRPKGLACDAGAFEICPITCPQNITIGNDPGECSAVVKYPAATADAICGAVSCSPASGSSFPVGTTTITCTATDASGNTSTCMFTITVNDTQAPSTTCPANITVPAAPNQCDAVVTFTTPTATDNCPGVGQTTCVPASGSTFPKGTTTVTCTASDGSGNPSSCPFTVTVNDTQPPSINCPANVTQSTDPNQCSAVVNYPAPTVSDNCPAVGTPVCSPPSGSTFLKGPTTVTCTVNDGSDNTSSCSFTVTINDTQPPSITCPANITRSTDPNQCSAIVSYPAPTVSDNCPGVGAPICLPPSGSTFPRGTTTVTCTVNDAAGIASTCSFTITVNDTQPPMITCPASVTAVSAVACPPSSSTTVTFAPPMASDNCPGVTVACNPPSGSIFPVGTTTVTCTATDASGNTATCSFMVTVFNGRLQDETNPQNVVLFNTTTGDYTLCCGGMRFSGRGLALLKGCVFTLQHYPPDRRLLVTVDFSQNRGTASLQSPPGTIKCTIIDRNMSDDTSTCP